MSFLKDGVEYAVHIVDDTLEGKRVTPWFTDKWEAIERAKVIRDNFRKTEGEKNKSVVVRSSDNFIVWYH